jgi:hypothetical protein
MQGKKAPLCVEIGQGDAHHPSTRVISDLKLPALPLFQREGPFEDLIHSLNNMDQNAFVGPQTDPFLIRDHSTI